MNPQNRRILLIDDMAAIHQDFRKILVGATETPDLDQVEAALFGDPRPKVRIGFEIDSAYQGQEGLQMLRAARQADRPYAMAFVDMRMPPGWDGVETVERLWRDDPLLQIVLCTAYSDASWDEVLERLDVGDRLLILKKPFDAIEVFQLACTLTAKWNMGRQAAAQLARLEEAVQERTSDITRANEALQAEVSERKHLQGQLVQSEKLASIGQLAAGVAHEINNPIGYIFSNFSTLQGYLDQLFLMLGAYQNAEASVSSPEHAATLLHLRAQVELEFLMQDIPELMRESLQGVVRVRQIVQDLKDFARVDSSAEWQFANLHNGIDSTLNMAASEIKYKADVVKEYGAIPDIECLPSQINQVVLNLVVNAAHAIADAQESGAQRPGRISVGTRRQGYWAELWVADTGTGIPPEVRTRVYDPFFTTKDVGRGTGQGLAIAR
ncbi:MAG: response regulator, partial [Burkholderiaceae bacterium]|nr:response regulator [Burkholderiaceae bacterium]